MKIMIKCCLSVFITVFLFGCASTNFTNIESDTSFEHVTDEKSLWKQVEEIQNKLVDSDAIYPDDDLHNYVNGVLDKLADGNKEQWGGDIDAHIIYDSDFNAAMYPNGFMIVNTGLLANIDNEAQLALILGHELTHFLHRHSLKQINNQVNITAALSTFRVAAVGAAYGLAYSGYDTSAISAIHDTISLGLQGMFYGYSRSSERDADQNGYELMEKAGYDTREAKAVLENMLKAQNLLDKKNKTPYFYSSHPKTKMRIDNYEKYLKELAKESGETVPATIKNEQEYMAQVKELIIDNLELDIKKSNINLAKSQMEKYIRTYSDDHKSLYFEALILLQEGQKDEAIRKLNKSKEMNKDNPAVLKELGIQLYKNEEKREAKENFQRYLEIQPDAKDAEFIRGYINE
ncbi:MAG: M48 family metalloprotease [Candidatus Omnitrophica bacterium]|nr:M48 family metalloprotease [Candidatus Omnitrophota bacterium]